MTSRPMPTLSRRAMLQAGLAAPLVPAQARSTPWRFASVGDWGRGGHDDQRAVAEAMGRACATFGPSHILSVGDNFYEDGVSSTRDPQWQGSFERIYDAPSLQRSWRVILGNHDYRGSVQAQLDYQDASRRWVLPARYWQRRERLPDGAFCDLFYIDTSPFLSRYRGSKVRIGDQDTAIQLRWLDRALGQSRATWKIVVGHHPVYTAHGGALDEPELVAALVPLLQAHGVRVYLNGHVHNLQHVRVQGIDYITNGGGSRIEGAGTSRAGGVTFLRHGFMTCGLDREAMDFAFLGSDGRRIYAASLLR